MKTIHLITPVSVPGLRNLDEIAHLASPTLSFTHSILDRGPPSIESEYEGAFAGGGGILR